MATTSCSIAHRSWAIAICIRQNFQIITRKKSRTCGKPHLSHREAPNVLPNKENDAVTRLNIPRALCGSVRAADTPEALFRNLQAAITGRFAEQGEHITNIAAALETINSRVGAGALGLSGASLLPVDAEYTQTFASYFRSGAGENFLREANASGERATVHAAMSVGSASDGGYLAPVEWDRRLQERQRATSPMRRLALVRPTTVGAYTTLWNLDTWGSGWVGETAVRPLTTSTGLAPVTFASGEIYAQPAATQRLLEDSALSIDAWLIESVDREFNKQEGIAFISGDGTNKPAGLLTYATGGTNAALHPGGAIQVVSGPLNFDQLTDFTFSLDAPYRANATWMMSSLTAAIISKLKDSAGNYYWRESLILGQPATLLGRPVEIDEGMPSPTVGNLCIAFGDFQQGYVINDRIGTRVLRDPYTNKPYVNFYVTKRVGGGVLDPFAIRLLKLTATPGSSNG
jgi:HK97 family phage major capsid protein